MCVRVRARLCTRRLQIFFDARIASTLYCTRANTAREYRIARVSSSLCRDDDEDGGGGSRGNRDPMLLFILRGKMSLAMRSDGVLVGYCAGYSMPESDSAKMQRRQTKFDRIENELNAFRRIKRKTNCISSKRYERNLSYSVCADCCQLTKSIEIWKRRCSALLCSAYIHTVTAYNTTFSFDVRMTFPLKRMQRMTCCIARTAKRQPNERTNERMRKKRKMREKKIEICWLCICGWIYVCADTTLFFPEVTSMMAWWGARSQ